MRYRWWASAPSTFEALVEDSQKPMRALNQHHMASTVSLWCDHQDLQIKIGTQWAPFTPEPPARTWIRRLQSLKGGVLLTGTIAGQRVLWKHPKRPLLQPFPFPRMLGSTMVQRLPGPDGWQDAVLAQTSAHERLKTPHAQVLPESVQGPKGLYKIWRGGGLGEIWWWGSIPMCVACFQR